MTNQNDDFDPEKLDQLDSKIKDAANRAGILTEEEKQELAEKQKKVIQASASAGVEFAAAIIFSTLFGIWLDKKIETAPIFMLIFIILGSCVAYYNLYRTSESLNSSSNDADSRLHQDEKKAKKTPD